MTVGRKNLHTARSRTAQTLSMKLRLGEYDSTQYAQYSHSVGSRRRLLIYVQISVRYLNETLARTMILTPRNA